MDKLLEIVLGVTLILWKLAKIDQRLDRIEQALRPAGVAEFIEFYTVNQGLKVRIKSMFLKVTQSLPLSIEIKDKFGNLAKADGAPAWALTDAALGSLEVAADGMSAILKPSGTVGLFKVQVSVDADLGEGVKAIVGELDVELLPGDAEVVNISAGQPTDV